jgi:hypothetical protein
MRKFNISLITAAAIAGGAAPAIAQAAPADIAGRKCWRPPWPVW